MTWRLGFPNDRLDEQANAETAVGSGTPLLFLFLAVEQFISLD